MERTRKAELTLQYLGGMKKLSAKELEYMEVIWQHQKGSAVTKFTPILLSLKVRKVLSYLTFLKKAM